MTVQHSPVRIAITEDHRLFRETLVRMLGLESGFKVVGEFETIGELQRFLRGNKCDILLLDLSLTDGSAFSFLEEQKGKPGPPTIIVSMYEDSLRVAKAMRLGARGYLTKGCNFQELTTAIRRVAGGGTYIDPRISDRVFEVILGQAKPEATLHDLSKREMEVFLEIARGLASKDIAKRLHLSPSTVSTYKENIKRKLNIRSDAAMIKLAIEAGIV